jgi:hypothetical protein
MYSVVADMETSPAGVRGDSHRGVKSSLVPDLRQCCKRLAMNALPLFDGLASKQPAGQIPQPRGFHLARTGAFHRGPVASFFVTGDCRGQPAHQQDLRRMGAEGHYLRAHSDAEPRQARQRV